MKCDADLELLGVFFKKKTEDMICAVLKQALRTNSVKYSIYEAATENLQHIITDCTHITRKDGGTMSNLQPRIYWEQNSKYAIEWTEN